LINDSHLPIVAYHAEAKCRIGKDISQSDETSFDAVSALYDEMSVQGPGGAVVSQQPVLAPKGRMVTGLKLEPQPNGCRWQAEIDAVLYADGSFRGNERSARNLRAHRSGIVASVTYWSHTLDRYETPKLMTFGPAQILEAIKVDAGKRTGEDLKACPQGRPNSICDYWSGRYAVDSEIALQVRNRSQGESTAQTYQRVFRSVSRLNKQIHTVI